MFRFTDEIGILKSRLPILKPTEVVNPAIAIGRRLAWKLAAITASAVEGFVAMSLIEIAPAPSKPFPDPPPPPFSEYCIVYDVKKGVPPLRSALPVTNSHTEAPAVPSVKIEA